MKITVEHEVPYDPEDESRCIYAGGDFWGKEVCQYHKRRDRTHGYKAPVERRLPRCMLFHEWLPGKYVKCEACRKAIGAKKKAEREKQERENPKPLTLEELMEMTREPVYDADDENWYVIDYVDIVDELSTLIVMTDSTEFDSENGLPKFYRTKPEGSEKE